LTCLPSNEADTSDPSLPPTSRRTSCPSRDKPFPRVDKLTYIADYSLFAGSWTGLSSCHVGLIGTLRPTARDFPDVTGRLDVLRMGDFLVPALGRIAKRVFEGS
jgi:hypothetical protein